MKRILFITLLLLGATMSRSQNVALKTNALFDAAMVPNLGAEVRASKHLSVNASAFVGYKIYGQDMNLQAANVDLRYWFMDFPMYGLFVGLDVSGAHYDFTFSREGYMGDAIASGINFGWAFVPKDRPHWHFELEATVGGVYFHHKHRWTQDYLFDREYNQRGMLFVPYRFGFNIVYSIPTRGEVDSKGAKDRRAKRREEKRAAKDAKKLGIDVKQLKKESKEAETSGTSTATEAGNGTSTEAGNGTATENPAATPATSEEQPKTETEQTESTETPETPAENNESQETEQ